MIQSHDTIRKDSELWPIPQEWEICRLGDIAKIKWGKRLPKWEMLISSKTEHPYIRITDLDLSWSIQKQWLQYVSDTIFPSIKNYTIDAGQVYISIVWTIGLIGIVPEDLHLASLTENCAKLEIEKTIDAKYIMYYLRSPIGQDEVMKNTVWAAQPKLPLWWIQNIQFPLPPPHEQQAIASILWSLDDKIEVLREQNRTLEKMGQVMFHERFGKYDIEDELPEGWRVGKLGEVWEFKNWINYSRDDWWDKEYKVISVKALSSSHRLDEQNIEVTKLESKKANNYLLDIWDIVIARSASPWSCILITNKIDSIVYSGFAIRLKPKDILRANYLFWLLRNDKEKIVNSWTWTIFININQQILINHEILIPDIEVLKQFDQQIETVTNKIISNNKEIQSLIKTRDSLLPRLMSGKVRVF